MCAPNLRSKGDEGLNDMSQNGVRDLHLTVYQQLTSDEMELAVG